MRNDADASKRERNDTKPPETQEGRNPTTPYATLAGAARQSSETLKSIPPRRNCPESSGACRYRCHIKYDDVKKSAYSLESCW